MSEQDLNQAKSKGGSFVECVCVSSKCSLFLVCVVQSPQLDCWKEMNIETTVSPNLRVQSVAETQTHSSVCAADSACNCEGAVPAAGGPSGRKRHM